MSTATGSPQTPARVRTRFTSSAIILAAVAIGVYSQFGALSSRYVFNGDARQHIFWMAQWGDPDIFRGDFHTEMAKGMQPWGFVILYRIASLVVEPFSFSKVLPIVLLVLTSWCVYRLLRELTGEITAVLGTLVFLVANTFFVEMVGGHSRAFGFPLIFLFLAFVHAKRETGALVCLLLAALLYPPVFLVLFVTVILAWCVNRFVQKWPVAHVSARAAPVLVASVLLLAIESHAMATNPAVGPTFSRSEMLGHSEFYARGRLQFLPNTPLWSTILRAFESGSAAAYRPIESLHRRLESGNQFWIPLRSVEALIVLLLGAVGLFRKSPEYARFLALFAASGAICFVGAEILLARLYIPLRYLTYTFAPLGLIIAAASFHALQDHLRMHKWLRGLLLCGSVSIVLFYVPATKDLALVDARGDEPLLEWIARLPKESIIAGEPTTVDNVPLVSRRSVLVSSEGSGGVFFKNYWPEIRRATFDFFSAYYASDIQDVRDFCSRYGVTHLLVDTEHFSMSFLRGRVYFEPFGSVVKADLNATPRTPALALLPDATKVFIAGTKFVAKCSDL